MITSAQLKAFRIFKDLNERELELIARMAKEHMKGPDELIVREKALADYMYLVVEGKVEIKISSNGEETVIDQVEPGGIFGWSAVTEPYTFTAAAKTLGKTKLITLKGERLLELFDTNNYIGYRVMIEIAAVISRRLKAMALKFAETSHAKKSH